MIRASVATLYRLDTIDYYKVRSQWLHRWNIKVATIATRSSTVFSEYSMSRRAPKLTTRGLTNHQIARGRRQAWPLVNIRARARRFSATSVRRGSLPMCTRAKNKMPYMRPVSTYGYVGQRRTRYNPPRLNRLEITGLWQGLLRYVNTVQVR